MSEETSTQRTIRLIREDERGMVLDKLWAKVFGLQPYTHTHDNTDVVKRSEVLRAIDEARQSND